MTLSTMTFFTGVFIPQPTAVMKLRLILPSSESIQRMIPSDAIPEETAITTLILSPAHGKKLKSLSGQMMLVQLNIGQKQHTSLANATNTIKMVTKNGQSILGQEMLCTGNHSMEKVAHNQETKNITKSPMLKDNAQGSHMIHG